MTITITPIKPTEQNVFTFKTQVYEKTEEEPIWNTPGVFQLGAVTYGQVYTPEVYHISLTDRDNVPREFTVQLVLARTLREYQLPVVNSRVDAIFASNLSNISRLLERVDNLPGPMGDDFRFGNSDIMHVFENLNLCKADDNLVNWVERKNFHRELDECHKVLADYITLFCKALTCNAKLKLITLPLAYAHSSV